MDGKRHHFTDLLCWKKASELRRSIYRIAAQLPETEKYNLTKQLRRVAISITANIAEGYGRFHYQENIQFCRQSRASLYECEDHLITCLDEGYCNKETFDRSLMLIVETRKILDGYIPFLSQQCKKSKSK
jgi:four helix bundle protein